MRLAFTSSQIEQDLDDTVLAYPPARRPELERETFPPGKRAGDEQESCSCAYSAYMSLQDAVGEP